MLRLATVTLSPRSLAISSSAGALIRHGPHHSAQKSTSTGPSAPNTSVAKLWSVTVLVVMGRISRQRLTAIWLFACSLSRHEFDELRAGRVEQGGADLAFREDHAQRLAVSDHLRAVTRWDIRVGRRHTSGLEVDDGHTLLLDQQPVHSAGNDPAVGQSRGQRRLAERPGTEQRTELRVGKDAADGVGDFACQHRVGDTGGSFEPANCRIAPALGVDFDQPLEELMDQSPAAAPRAPRLARGGP